MYLQPPLMRGMFIAALFHALLALVSVCDAQEVYTQDDDPINIVGTWSSGSGAVETGLVRTNMCYLQIC